MLADRAPADSVSSQVGHRTGRRHRKLTGILAACRDVRYKGGGRGITVPCSCSHPLPPPPSSSMVPFKPLLVVAFATLLAESTVASPFLFARQQATDAILNATDPHAAAPVPENFTSPIADGGVAWADAFAKAKALVDQMVRSPSPRLALHVLLDDHPS